MKSALDALMAKRQLEAIVVLASHDYSPELDYLVGGGAYHRRDGMEKTR